MDTNLNHCGAHLAEFDVVEIYRQGWLGVGQRGQLSVMVVVTAKVRCRECGRIELRRDQFPVFAPAPLWRMLATMAWRKFVGRVCDAAQPNRNHRRLAESADTKE